MLATVEAYVQRLVGGGADAGDDGVDTLDAWADEAPVLAGLATASVQGRAALGPRVAHDQEISQHPESREMLLDARDGEAGATINNRLTE